MAFREPQYLHLGWLLLIVGIWFGVSLWSLRKARLDLAAALGAPASSASGLLGRAVQMLLVLAAMACVILALARPQSRISTLTPKLRRVDAVILMDVSPSMRAEDILPSRIARATEVIGTFVQKKLEGDRIGLVSFAGNSLVLSYLTADPGNLLFYMDYLREDPALRYGTDFGAALKSGMTVFTEGEQEAPESISNRKILILVSDGEDFGEQLQAEVREVIRRHIPIYSVGIGARNGVPIPLGYRYGKRLFLEGEHGAPQLTSFDESTLQEVADRTGGHYYRAPTGTGIERAFEDIFRKARSTIGYTRVYSTQERYQEFLAAALLLFVIKLVV